MPVLTPAERRGASVLVLLLALGAGWDAWRAARPRYRAVEDVAPVVATPPSTPPAPALPAGGRPDSAPAPPAAEALDLNAAGIAELDALPGIGPVLAARIVEHRARHGPFRSPDELLAVPGIGPRLAERLRPRVRCGPARR